jgi:hypothetical protein
MNWGWRLAITARRAPEEDLPPGVPVLRRGSHLLALLAKKAELQNSLMRVVLEDNGAGLRSLVQLLDVAKVRRRGGYSTPGTGENRMTR